MTVGDALTRFKARLVAAGYSQIEGVDYNEIFSPVVKIQTVRLIVALAIVYSLEIEQIDISTAFLYGDLEEPNYMNMPEGFIEYDENRNAKLCKLKKSLYGLQFTPSIQTMVEKARNAFKINGF
jgi:ATP-binding cassette subfamily B (MDR/TAP) protein 1